MCSRKRRANGHRSHGGNADLRVCEAPETGLQFVVRHESGYLSVLVGAINLFFIAVTGFCEKPHGIGYLIMG